MLNYKKNNYVRLGANLIWILFTDFVQLILLPSEKAVRLCSVSDSLYIMQNFKNFDAAPALASLISTYYEMGKNA
jgi:hypothetical protein